VATRVGGVPELVGDAAVLCPPGDPQKVANALAYVLGSQELCAVNVEKGRSLAATWPGPREELQAVLSAYRTSDPP
jgi:glycosyltransferase involved in cell wall biosynthesis